MKKNKVFTTNGQHVLMANNTSRDMIPSEEQTDGVSVNTETSANERAVVFNWTKTTSILTAKMDNEAKNDNNNSSQKILHFQEGSFYQRSEKSSSQSPKKRRGSDLSLGVGSNDPKACCYFNPSTKQGRRTQLSRILFISLLPVAVLIIQNSITLYGISGDVHTRQMMKQNIIVSVETGVLVHHLQIERGTTALFTSSWGDAEVGRRLHTKLYKNTDAAIDGLSMWPELANAPSYYETGHTLHAHINAHRASLDPNNTTISAEIHFYSAIIEQIIKWVAGSVQHAKNGDLWRNLVAYHLLIVAKEQAGIERALGSTFFARGKFPLDDLLWYWDTLHLGKSYLNSSILYSEQVEQLYGTRFGGTKLQARIEAMRAEIRRNKYGNGSVQMGTWWFDNMTLYTDILKDIQVALAATTVSVLDAKLDEAKREIVVFISLTIFVVSLFPLTSLIVTKLLNAILTFALCLQEKTKALDQERKKTVFLLHQMLPVSVAQRLINNGIVQPENYDSVTIYFSDIVGFTQISSECSPMEVVSILNLLYEEFDNQVETYDVYKVETIGDAYMVVSGLPERNGKRHCSEIAKLALVLRNSVPGLKIDRLPNKQLQLRIGINTGPCVAGVVGHKMPRYCLFGDTVNTASRMESTATPGCIHISQTTYSLLKETGGFIMSRRGEIEVKGKGKMTTYWLEGTQSPN